MTRVNEVICDFCKTARAAAPDPHPTAPNAPPEGWQNVVIEFQPHIVSAKGRWELHVCEGCLVTAAKVRGGNVPKQPWPGPEAASFLRGCFVASLRVGHG